MTNLDARPAPAGKPAHLDSTATGETDHTPAHGLPSATYLLAGAPFQPDTDLGQSLLDEAYGKHERPQCPCTPQGVPMYIAKVGVRYIVKRMPETGLAHSPSCASYVPEHLTAFGQLLGDAVRVDPDSGQTVLRLGFRLSVGERAAPDMTGPPVAADSVRTNGKRLSLRALLDFLWHESDLVAWSPGMAGRRHWGLVAWLLRQAAGTARAKGHPLSERIFVPEPFRLERKAQIAARRLNTWQRAAARPGRAQQLLVLIGEVKTIEAARYGHKIVFKHLPDAPLFLDEDLHRKLVRRFAQELDLWAADEGGHLMAIATFVTGRGGSANAEEVALMPTTSSWLPYDDPYAKVLLESLVDQNRRFRTLPRFTQPASTTHPVAVLTDCAEPQALRLRLEHPSQLELISNDALGWTWDVSGPIPPLPQPVR